MSIVAVLISANTEWQHIKSYFGDSVQYQASPLGEWCYKEFQTKTGTYNVLFFHSGWGKIVSAASTQYVIDHWDPNVIFNLGTCGGFEGRIEKNTTVLVQKTIVYDIYEEMGNSGDPIRFYATELDLSWINRETPYPVLKSHIVSGDRDLLLKDIPYLVSEYDAVAGDWESGAIAWVAKRNNKHLLILRSVSDLVSPSGGEAYDGSFQVFVENSRRIMLEHVKQLPDWIDFYYQSITSNRL